MMSIILLASTLAAAQDAPGLEFFEKKIRPLLAERCYECHSARAKKLKGGLLLDTREGLIKGGDSGAAIVPGDPDRSRLIAAVRYADENLQMPPKAKIEESQIADLVEWVRRGAPDPRHAKTPPSASAGPHWAFKPPADPPVPAVRRKEWVSTPIDAFILARIEERRLSPAPAADRRTLIRRATFDLTGLPPAPEEVEAFVADGSWEKVVDRLLASPRYGERWGRLWLDVARYADTKGYVFEEERRFPFSYTYRDWVIRAFNEDLPYDQFILRQIAADRLELGEDKGALAALGFLTVGRRFLNRLPDIIDDRIDVVTRGLMGLTVSCARCHDHKYDPIPTRDYYSLYGIFLNSPESENPPEIGPAVDPEQAKAYEKDRQAREAEIRKFLEARHKEIVPALSKPEVVTEYLVAAHEATVKMDDGQLRAFAQKRDLRSFLLERWRAHLRKSAESGDPFFAPWHAFAALPAAEFEAKAPAVAARFKALEPPPISMRQVAERYSRLLKPRLDDPDSPTVVSIEEVENLLPRDKREQLRNLRKKGDAIAVTHPGAPQHAMAVREADRLKESRVFIRGNSNNTGDVVPRQFLEVLSGPDRKPFANGSGRLELARAIANPANPLTARVMVNRVWANHFGSGLVTTPSDFGTRSDAPSHPELLDWLARRFVENSASTPLGMNWSVKKLHRLILLSSTYRQGGAPGAQDPENRILARMAPRRLDLESMRDSLLWASGRLDLKTGGRPVDLLSQPFTGRRTVYGYVERQNLPSMFRTFDFASPDLHTPQRHPTTVPQQALFMLNSPFVVQQVRLLAARPEIAGRPDPAARVEALHRLLFQRVPSPEERRRALAFLNGAAPSGEAVADALPAWLCGYGEYDAGEQRVKTFTPLPHFTGDSWQGGAKLPDRKLGWVLLTAQGGHAGNDAAHAAIRRWTAPHDAVIDVTGQLGHKSASGDGVQARVVSSESGELASWVASRSEAETKLSGLSVRAGETIDFVVDCRKGVDSDDFTWAPVIRQVSPAAGAVEWNALTGFSGPPTAPRRPLSTWERYVQVLLLSNEFLFVD